MIDKHEGVCMTLSIMLQKCCKLHFDGFDSVASASAATSMFKVVEQSSRLSTVLVIAHNLKPLSSAHDW